MVPRVQNALFDYLIDKYKLKNDRALADMLGLEKPVVSKMRNKKRVINADVILRVHELTGLEIAEIKKIMRGEK